MNTQTILSEKNISIALQLWIFLLSKVDEDKKHHQQAYPFSSLAVGTGGRGTRKIDLSISNKKNQNTKFQGNAILFYSF